MYSNNGRRGSIQSLGGNSTQQQSGLDSRASSIYGGISTHPMDPNYGTSLQSMASEFANDPRFQAPRLQDRSHPLDGGRRKLSHPHLFKDQRGGKGPRPSSSASSLRAKTSPLETTGVAIPRWKGDRHAAPREQDSMAGAAQSLESTASMTPKASTQYLPGAVFSTSPTNHGVQGSEYSIHTLKSLGSNINNKDTNNDTDTDTDTDTNKYNTRGRNNSAGSYSGNPGSSRGRSVATAASIFNNPGGSASLPPLPPSDAGTSLQQFPRNRNKRGSVASATFDPDSSGMPMSQTKRKPSVPKDEDEDSSADH